MLTKKDLDILTEQYTNLPKLCLLESIFLRMILANDGKGDLETQITIIEEYILELIPDVNLEKICTELYEMYQVLLKDAMQKEVQLNSRKIIWYFIMKYKKREEISSITTEVQI